MGLDITAYSRMTKVEVELDEEGDPVNQDIYYTHARVYAAGFRGQHDDLEDGAFYAYEDEFGFRAGSYSGYSAWRGQLAKFAGYPKLRATDGHTAACWEGAEGPFAELIDFSDCEGSIGPATSAKLARDFAEHEERARTFDAGPDDEGWFFRKYQEWKQAFEFAADGGMVAFH